MASIFRTRTIDDGGGCWFELFYGEQPYSEEDDEYGVGFCGVGFCFKDKTA